ncbi:hypothetical protein BKA56DRAFT_622261 [Ilyonectria sp. MPI-CAGE-AT-0026]|nr:hypothetical protein BKA56DRAFT_622261 [Ilyonectria sp. MPI-CAGE-AT-0026]
MRSFVTYAIFAYATLAAASIDPRFEFPDTVPAIERRQEPGTPLYQCHEDCGLLITLGRTAGYCSNAEWNQRYGRCMSCANTYNIWQYYGTSVTSLAKTCGLTPSPSPSAAPAVAARTVDRRFEYHYTV